MAQSRLPLGPQDFDYAKYSRVSLDDVINNFIVAYTGKDKVLSKVPRHEVAFWAQRAVQEFTYDIFRSEKNIEYELGPTRKLALPNDFVNMVKVTWIDSQGTERVAYRNRQASPSKGALQDENYDQLYDNDGLPLFADESEQEKRFQDPSVRDELLDLAQNYYYNYITDYNYSYYNESYYGRQWGANPEEVNVNGTYLLDWDRGLIVFDYLFREGQLVTVRYLSDGLAENDDLENVYIPKLAEDAIYARVLYELAKIRPSAAGAAGLYKKEAYAKMKNTKIRLMDLKAEEMAQLMRAKSKWIKH